MSALLEPAHTPILILASAGMIMVITLYTSKRAKKVLKTSIDLSKYESTDENHRPNIVSRSLVRGAVAIGKFTSRIMPDFMTRQVELRFARPAVALPQGKEYEAPAFDMVRASVNVIVPAILISWGTSSTLPLSTTYVTFMVAMGSSLADKAWGRESAVYRVAGVLKVILGWFATAFFAFIAAGTFATFVYHYFMLAIIPLLILGVVIMTISRMRKRSTRREERRQKLLRTTQHGMSISEVIEDSAERVSESFTHATDIYSSVAIGLNSQDRRSLKHACSMAAELKEDIRDLQNSVFHMVKSIDDRGLEASRFYILILDYLKDINRALTNISEASLEHVENNHKEFKETRKEALLHMSGELCSIFDDIKRCFLTRDFSGVKSILARKKELKKFLNALIERQISKIRDESMDLSPKNTNLYLSIILETKDLLSASTHLAELGLQFYVDKKATSKD